MRHLFAPTPLIGLLVLLVPISTLVNAIGIGTDAARYALLAEMGLNADGTSFRDAEPDLRRRQELEYLEESIEAETVMLALDHFGNGSIGGMSAFRNRFWATDRSYKPGGPVFIYDSGETNAELGAMFRLTNEGSFLKHLVDEFGGIGIVWEHRYYGASTPVDVDVETPPEAFEFLTTGQALADVKQFAFNFSRPSLPGVDLTPNGTPWVFLGGSYPGMRAAFMRHRYPETIYASLASSAPVQAAIPMNYYFDVVERGMRKYGWANCTADIRAAVRYMDQVMADPGRSFTLKEDFLGRGAGLNSNAAFAEALSMIFYLWQSHGVEGGPQSLRSFCDWISTDPFTKRTSPARGWAATRGPRYAVNRWSKWPGFKDVVNANARTECEGVRNSSSLRPDCDLTRPSTEPDVISWTWQYCTEWGFFQYSNYGERQVVSGWNDLKHQQEKCKLQFAEAYRHGLLPEWPDTVESNKEFGGWDIRPSNVYWTNGEFDPWRALSPQSEEWFAPKYPSTQEIPKCGESPGEKGPVFGMVLRNAQHCYDFQVPGVPDSEISRGQFRDALREWLKCWHPSNGTKPGEGSD